MAEQVPDDSHGTNDQEADVVDLVEQIGLLEDDGAEGQPGKSQGCAGEQVVAAVKGVLESHFHGFPSLMSTFRCWDA